MVRDILEKAYLLFSPFRKSFSITPHHLKAYFEELSRFPELNPYLDIDLPEAIRALKRQGVLEESATSIKDINAVRINPVHREAFKTARQKPESDAVFTAYLNYYSHLAWSLINTEHSREPTQEDWIHTFIELETANFEFVSFLAIGFDAEPFYYLQQLWGEHLVHIGDFAGAISHTSRVLENLPTDDNNWMKDSPYDLGYIYGIRASAYNRKGEWEKASVDFEQCIKYSKDPLDQARGLREWGNVALKQSHYQEALHHHEAAIKIYEEHDRLLDRSSSIQEKALILGHLHRHNEAKKLLLDLLAFYKGQDDTPYLRAKAYNSLAILCNGMGDFAACKKYSQKALAIDGAYTGRNLEKVQGLMNLSIACRKLKEYEEAEDHIKEAIAIHYHLPDMVMMAPLKENLGALASQRGKMAEAIEHTLEAVAIYESLDEKANCYANLGHYYREDKQFEASIEAFENAKQLYRKSGTEGVAIDSFCNHQYKVCQHMSDPRGTIRYLKEAIDCATDDKRKLMHMMNLGVLQGKHRYLDDAHISVDEAIDFLVSHFDQDAIDRFHGPLERLRKALQGES